MTPKTRKILNQTSSTIINEQTGEIISSKETSTIKISIEPSFVKLYLDAVMYIADVPTSIANVVCCILKRLPYADSKSNEIVLNKCVRQKIAEEIGYSEAYVKKSIINLVKGKLLIHDDSTKRSCNYQVNPYIFGKGEWKDIEELRLHIKFNSEGKTFWGEVQKAKDEKALNEAAKIINSLADTLDCENKQEK